MSLIDFDSIYPKDEFRFEEEHYYRYWVIGDDGKAI